VATTTVAVSAQCAIAPNSSYAFATCPLNIQNTAQGGSPYFVVDIVLESANIYYYNNSSGTLSCFGWEDNL
jgi:hypothetical protein